MSASGALRAASGGAGDTTRGAGTGGTPPAAAPPDGSSAPGAELALRERLVDAAPHRWWLVEGGAADGPSCLFLHGTGASAHSFLPLARHLAPRYRLLLPDLPAHARTRTPADAPLSLERVAGDLARLLETLGERPALVVGHSAGAALAARAALAGALPGARLVGIAPAMLLPAGLAGWLFPPLARVVAGSRLLPRLFARRARDPREVRRLIEGTGSTLDAEGIRAYQRLFTDPEHVANVLRHMAEWNLGELEPLLPALAREVRLIAGARDRTVPPRSVRRQAALLPKARLELLEGLGHLAHEEDPARLARLIEPALASTRDDTKRGGGSA